MQWNKVTKLGSVLEFHPLEFLFVEKELHIYTVNLDIVAKLYVCELDGF